jgi:hypothetical protein
MAAAGVMAAGAEAPAAAACMAEVKVFYQDLYRG